MQPHLVTPQTSPVIINATSIWLVSIIQRSKQTSGADGGVRLEALSAGRKALMIRNSSFVERFVHVKFTKQSEDECIRSNNSTFKFCSCVVCCRFLGNFARHQRAFSKLVIHLIAVYCRALQHGALYPEAKASASTSIVLFIQYFRKRFHEAFRKPASLIDRLIDWLADALRWIDRVLYPELFRWVFLFFQEHIMAGLYRLLDTIDPHSRSMGTVTMSVESREIYKTLVEDHQRFHKYRGLV